MYCSHCGKKMNDSGALFFPECGARLLSWLDSEKTEGAVVEEEPIVCEEFRKEAILSDIRSINKKHLLLILGVILLGLIGIYQIMILVSDTELSVAKDHIDEMAVYYENMWKRAAELELQEEGTGIAGIEKEDQILEHWQQKVADSESELLEIRKNLTDAGQRKLDVYYMEKIGQKSF